MLFRVRDEVFERFPRYCVGLVVVEGLDNTAPRDEVTLLLRESEAQLRARYTLEALRASEALRVWRDAFRAAGINVTKYRTSVEALSARVLKGDKLPALTPAVDLANAVSLKFLVPLGAHDLHLMSGDLMVGPLPEALPFRPIGSSAVETAPEGEYVYADDAEVRTRLWVWRQSDTSKVTAATSAIVFPIDGWLGSTDEAVRAAVETLAAALHALFGLEPRVAFVDRNATSVLLHADRPRIDTVLATAEGYAMAGNAGLERMVGASTAGKAGGVSLTSAPTAQHRGVHAGTAVDGALDSLLTRRTMDVVVREHLAQRLRRGDKLRVKFGVDPTGPQLHLGHAVQLRKLREFQQHGHTICLVVGDFTAQIGDASDKTAMRQMLTEEQIYENLKSYRRQIAKVLDEDAVEWRYNNDWLGPLRFRDVIQLAAQFTVAQMLERENFTLRFDAGRPIGLHEFMYPLMQGYDSVALHADVEIGGTEQLFNLMAGRTLQEAFGQRPQAVITCRLLLGTDGQKMSKTAGNCIYIDDPAREMYAKVMSITDSQILPYFDLCTDVPQTDLVAVERALAAGENPMSIKKGLAHEVTRLYHTVAQADRAQEAFEREVQRKEVPAEIPAVDLDSTPRPLADLLVELGLAPSKSEARRLAQQHGVRVDGDVVADPTTIMQVVDGMLIQVGKRRYARVRLRR